MDHRSKLVALLLCCFAGMVQAGYAYPATPAGVTTASAGGLQVQVAANDSVVNRLVRRASGPVVNVGGRAVTMPAAMRLAANASTMAARGIHPLVVAGVVLAPVVLDWMDDAGFFVQGSQVVKSDPNVCTVGPCYAYQGMNNGLWYSTLLEAAQNSVYASPPPGCTGYSIFRWRLEGVDAPQTMRFTYGYCNNTYPFSPTSTLITRNQVAPSAPTYVPVSPQEFEDGIAPTVIPDAVPKALPFPLPVDAPIVNPSPGDNPVSQPQRFPQGSPMPVPNTDPQQWRQPVVDLVPAPTPSTPWRIEVIPRDIITQSPTAPAPLPESAPVTEPAADPATEPATNPDLCEKNPDILACQKIELGTLDPVDVPNTNRQMGINKDTGWGPENGSCPAPKTATIMGVNLSMPFTMICEFATAIKPMLIGFAWLSAALTFFGLGRKD